MIQELQDIIKTQEEVERSVSIVWDEYIFDGRSLEEWDQYFYFRIPNDPTVEDIRKLFAHVGTSIQITSNYYSRCSSVLLLLTSIKAKALTKSVKEIVDGYEKKNAKRPAEKIVSALALENIDDLSINQQLFEILVKYWKEKKETLVETRKVLEQIHISMNVEMKHLER